MYCTYYRFQTVNGSSNIDSTSTGCVPLHIHRVPVSICSFVYSNAFVLARHPRHPRPEFLCFFVAVVCKARTVSRCDGEPVITGVHLVLLAGRPPSLQPRPSSANISPKYEANTKAAMRCCVLRCNVGASCLHDSQQWR